MKANGFTLVEVMVALLIFGMIAVAGVTVMRSTIDSQSIVRAQVDRIGEFAAIGVTRVHLRFIEISDVDHLELVASEVLPQVVTL